MIPLDIWLVAFGRWFPAAPAPALPPDVIDLNAERRRRAGHGTGRRL